MNAELLELGRKWRVMQYRQADRRRRLRNAALTLFGVEPEPCVPSEPRYGPVWRILRPGRHLMTEYHDYWYQDEDDVDMNMVTYGKAMATADTKRHTAKLPSENPQALAWAVDH